jgi:hypothetical protein
MAMLLAAPYARTRTRLHVHVDLEAVVSRGENECVVDLKLSLTRELTTRFDEADALGLLLELNLVLAVLTHVKNHLHG